MGLAELARRAVVERDTIADLENGSRALWPRKPRRDSR
jgi:hypothetical protein